MSLLTDYHFHATVRWAREQMTSSDEMWRALNNMAQYLALTGASTEAHAVWQFAYSGAVVIPEETKEGDSSITSFCVQHQLPDMSQGRPGYKYVRRPDDMHHRYAIHDEVIRRGLTKALPGPEDLIHGLKLARPTTLRISQTESEALPYLYRYLDGDHASRKEIIDVCLLCADIECRLKNREKANELLKRSYNNVGTLDTSYVYHVLGLAGTASLCYHGALSHVSEMKPAKRQKTVTDLLDRLSGKSKPKLNKPIKWTPERWRKVLDDFRREYIKKNIDDIDPQMIFQRPPASAEAIASVEARLGLTLPLSYRTFLEATNGYADLGHAYPGEFFAVENLVRQGDIDEDIHFLIDDVPDPSTGIEITRNIASRSLRITAWGDVSILLLSPDMITDGESACLDYASWHPGINVYPSFGDWFESRLRSLKNEDRRMI